MLLGPNISLSLDDSAIELIESPRPKGDVHQDSLPVAPFPSSSKRKNPALITKDEDYFMEATFVVYQVYTTIMSTIGSILCLTESTILGREVLIQGSFLSLFEGVAYI